jgi:DNA-binding response OmpR family regulator
MAKVLIVEDSKSQAAIMAEIVRNAGHEPSIASDSAAIVMKAVQSTVPELVLLDLVLLGPDGQPAADGFQLCGEIKRKNPKTKVLIVSAKGDEDSTEWAMAQGADGFLQKPFTVDDLIGVIEQVIGTVKG